MDKQESDERQYAGGSAKPAGFFSSIVRHLPGELAVVNPNRIIVEASEQFEAAHKNGYPSVIGRHCYEVIYQRKHPCSESGEECTLEKMLRSNCCTEVHHQHLDQNNQYCTIQETASPLFDASGELAFAVVLLQNLDAQWHDEQEVYRCEKNRLNQQKFESLGVLAGGIAHDFNNLLAGILGFTEISLDEVPKNSRLYENLVQVKAVTERAAGLSRQMLTYLGKDIFPAESVSLTQIIKSQKGLLSSAAPQNIKLYFDLLEAIPAIEGDSDQLIRAVQNLLQNAIEAIGEAPGLIAIRTGTTIHDGGVFENYYLQGELPAGDYAFLEVADNGCGIDSSIRPQIFDRFYSTKFLGRGLGLATVQGIMQAHKGGIKVYSTPRTGTAIILLFPLPEAEA